MEPTIAPDAGRRMSRASLWVRPVLMTVGGLAVAALLLLADQEIAAALLVLAAVFMGYWTSPLRAGRHEPFTQALARRDDAHAIILWAPGDPLSARLQTAVRGDREDVAWVNVLRDPCAVEFLEAHGGRGALPLVVVGSTVLRRATASQYLEAKVEGEQRAAAAD
ncbi:hypothetical protein Bra3105_09890 [Brachybacterium halotolerans subsp. kimchii]|uniref:hypothetical protein n=1 Tax=Brachybacterium TaxID=43668 RepID=UPI001E4E22D5|nr:MULTISPECIES: hypothetical protein [Brachybacterium]MCG7308943.1 hypothetical protein [Brachybacterium sp. ACRRE]UEJ81174.1 hypothetical protein Bra3105_09890 [Brachybacterium halotolerans subsp. kimchii]